MNRKTHFRVTGYIIAQIFLTGAFGSPLSKNFKATLELRWNQRTVIDN